MTLEEFNELNKDEKKVEDEQEVIGPDGAMDVDGEEAAEESEEDLERKHEEELAAMRAKITPEYEPVSFDVQSIPPYVSYDIVPLPSKGECYPHKKRRIPVKYLTASEENIFNSPNMYHHGQVIDVILKRCILDKDFDVDAMPVGDRDALVIWLRANAYGPKMTIPYVHPNDVEKTVNVEVDLSKFRVKDFTLKGDENGWFDYTTSKGDVIKFRFLTKKDTEDLIDKSRKEIEGISIGSMAASLTELKNELNAIERMRVVDDEPLHDAIDYIAEWVAAEVKEKLGDMTMYEPHLITDTMTMYTMSVNGNTDREFIAHYIENMRSVEARKYREYVISNTPGLDLSIEYDIPESEGGGRLSTSFRYDDTFFISLD